MAGIKRMCVSVFKEITTELVGSFSSIVEVPHNDERICRLSYTFAERIAIICSAMCDIVARQNDIARRGDDLGRQWRASSFHVAHGSIKKLGGAYARGTHCPTKVLSLREFDAINGDIVPEWALSLVNQRGGGEGTWQWNTGKTHHSCTCVCPRIRNKCITEY